MQSMEKTQGQNWAPMKKDSKRNDILFCRSGKKNQWKSKLTDVSVNKIWNKWGSLMNKLGYSKDGVSEGFNQDNLFQ